MLRSLRNHNQADDLQVYIIHEAIDGADKALFVQYISEFLPSASLIQVNSSLLNEFPVFGHISIATYFRLLIPSVLPPILKRALFLDSDIVIQDSLNDLWHTPMEGMPVAAVSDRNLEMQRKRLGMAVDAPYFNAGVLLIDLEQWRHENILGKGLDFARDNADKLDNWDQDVLNHLFEKRVRIVHQRWNAMAHLWGLDPAWLQAQGSLTMEEQEAHDNPAIVHFAGGGIAKPWNYRCPHPRKDDYRQILANTPWAGVGMDETPSRQPSNPIRRAAQKAVRLLNKA